MESTDGRGDELGRRRSDSRVSEFADARTTRLLQAVLGKVRMRRLTLLLGGFAVLVTGIVVASFASATKADTRWAIDRASTLVWRLAVAAIVLALSLTPAASLLESEQEDGVHGPSYPYYSRDGAWVAFTSDRSGTRDLYVARVGGTADRLTETDHGVSQADR